MQITFTAADGALITVADPRHKQQEDSKALPDERVPSSWIMSTMQVDLPEERAPSSWIMTTMPATLPEERTPPAAMVSRMHALPEERRPAGWVTGAMKV